MARYIRQFRKGLETHKYGTFIKKHSTQSKLFKLIYVYIILLVSLQKYKIKINIKYQLRITLPIKMEKDVIEYNFTQQLRYDSLIDQIIVVSLKENCKIRYDSHQIRWITSLSIISSRQFQEEISFRPTPKNEQYYKYVGIGNSLILKLCFCEKDKKPITKLKTSIRGSGNQQNLVKYPSGMAFEEYIYFERTDRLEGKIIIQDLQMVEVANDRQLQIPGQNSYEVIRLPISCQTVPEENSSNEQLIQKTRYLLIKMIDLQDHDTIYQFFEPSVTFKHVFKGSKSFIDYQNFNEFCFPQGVQLLKQVIGSGYQIINFILTQQDNSRLYVNCLQFKIKLPRTLIESLPSNSVDKHLHDSQIFYAQQALCIVSQYCYTDFFHTVLQEIFRKYLSLQNSRYYQQRNAKSQGYILNDDQHQFRNLVYQFIKNYEVGLADAQKQLNEAEYFKETIKIGMDWYQKRFTFPMPVEQSATNFSPKAVHCLFSVLNTQKIVEIFLALLLQRKIFLVSDSQVVLGYVLESLLSFLYPLKWQHVILPIITQKFLQLLDAPMPLIAGIPTAFATDELIQSAKQTTIVFLDCNEIISKQAIFEAKDINHLKQVIKKLRTYQIYSKDHVAQMLSLKDQFYLFSIYQKQNQKIFSAEHIKHIFFQVMLLFLQNYNKFYNGRNINNSPEKIVQQVKRQFNFKKDYSIQQFITSHPKSLHKFMRKFTQCSHFITFIYQYLDSSKNPYKTFIDQALSTQKANKSPAKFAHNRLSQPPITNKFDIQNLKKKSSLQSHHNITWSPPPKKSQEVSTNYSRNIEKFSMKIEDVEFEKEPSVFNEEQNMKKTKGGQICEAITRAMTKAAYTRKNMMAWTQARVIRLKKLFGGKIQNEPKKNAQQVKEENKKEECPQRKMSKNL